MKYKKYKTEHIHDNFYEFLKADYGLALEWELLEDTVIGRPIHIQGFYLKKQH